MVGIFEQKEAKVAKGIRRGEEIESVCHGWVDFPWLKPWAIVGHPCGTLRGD